MGLDKLSVYAISHKFETELLPLMVMNFGACYLVASGPPGSAYHHIYM